MLRIFNLFLSYLAIPPNGIYVESITEERASRCLSRLDLLSKVRETILWYPDLDRRLELCQRGPDMPEWWIPGQHDKELLIGSKLFFQPVW